MTVHPESVDKITSEELKGLQVTNIRALNLLLFIYISSVSAVIDIELEIA